MSWYGMVVERQRQSALKNVDCEILKPQWLKMWLY